MNVFKNAKQYITAHFLQHRKRNVTISCFHCDRMSVVLGDGWQLVLNVLLGVFCVWVQVVRVLIVTCESVVGGSMVCCCCVRYVCAVVGS